ncbi:LOW QUALITY PROTEIN: bcl-2/adenovirus E1B 19 kDa-interacting protein 2-like protein, partial [Podargus strigoides]
PGRVLGVRGPQLPSLQPSSLLGTGPPRVGFGGPHVQGGQGSTRTHLTKVLRGLTSSCLSSPGGAAGGPTRWPGAVTHTLPGLNFPFSSTFASRFSFCDRSGTALLTRTLFPGVHTPPPIPPRVRGGFWGPTVWMGGAWCGTPQIQPSREETGCGGMWPNQFGATSAITRARQWWGATGRERLPREVSVPVLRLPLLEGSTGTQGVPRRTWRWLLMLEGTESAEHSPSGSKKLDLDALETPSGSDGFKWEGETHPRWGHGGPPRSSPQCCAHPLPAEELSEPGACDPWVPFLSPLALGGDRHLLCYPLLRPWHHNKGFGAILLFATCHLPHSSVPRYIVGTLERTVGNCYVPVCPSRAAAWGQIPSFGWTCCGAVDGW